MNLLFKTVETNGNYIVEYEFHQNNSFKVYSNSQEYIGKWKSKNSRIYFELKDSASNKTYRKYELDYKIVNDSLFLKHPKFRGIGCGQERIKKAIKEVGSARQFLTELKNIVFQ